ncbi:MAG: hypothetical protein WBI57_09270 [Desulfobacterales bacterium]
MGKFDGGKIKMPRKMCMNAQNSGHALEPQGRIYTMKNSFFAAISPPIRRFSAG